ncbi:MAG: tail fiber domain-containing protein [Cyclobacteriaceae bacterium]
MYVIYMFAASYSVFSQDRSVGINTSTPNNHAVLELVAPDNNQGFLVPRLTTEQRLALSLTTNENGLLVFDNELTGFYYWSTSEWRPLLSEVSNPQLSYDSFVLSISDGNSIDLSNLNQTLVRTNDILSLSNGNSIDIGDLRTVEVDGDSTNEIQSLVFVDGIISLSGDPINSVIDLGSYDNNVEDDFDGDFSSLTGVPDDIDLSITNEIQDISTSGTAGNIAISDGSTLNLNVDDADADPTNENQTVSAGTGISVNQTGQDFQVTNSSPDQTVSLADGGAGNVDIGGTYPSFTIDVASLDDADADPTNENQTVSAGAGISVNQTGQDFQVTNSSPDQTVSLADGGAGNVDIGGTYPSFTIDVASLDDADADPTNENQTVSAGTGISVNQTGQDFQVTNSSPDQTVSLADGGAGNVDIGGTYPSFTIDVASLDDADSDPTNENQTVSAGTGISVNQTGQDFQVTNSSPDQTVSLADGGAGNVDIGGTYPSFTIDVASLDDADADPTNENQTVSAGTGISVNQTGQDFQVTNSSPDQTVSLADGGAGNVDIGGTYPSFTIDVASLDDADADPNNEIELPDQAGNSGSFLTTNGTAASWAALGALALLDNVTTTQISNGTITADDLNVSVAGDGITGGAGSALDIDLAASSGLETSGGQLQMTDVTSGTTYNIVIGGSVTYNNRGQITATGLSDERLKRDTIPLANILEKLLPVKGYTYYWKDENQPGIQYGFIAQQLEEYFPDLVITQPNGVKSVNYNGMIPVLLQALKEQQNRIDFYGSELGKQVIINSEQAVQITMLQEQLQSILLLINKSKAFGDQ